jgi:hypothetical protein
MNSPLVTIVIPYYQNLKHLGIAIQSALDQEHVQLQIVLVDNASTDGSRQIAEQFDDPRIERIYLTANLGATGGIQAGYQQARGEWVGLLPADDRWHPGFVKTLLAAFSQKPEIDIIFSNFRDIDDDGNAFEWKERGDTWRKWALPSYESGAFQEDIVGWNMVHQFQTMLWRSDLLRETLPFPVGVIPCDWALSLRAFHRGARLLFVNECLVDNRVHTAQVGSTMDSRTYALHFLYVHLSEFCLPMIRRNKPVSPLWATRFIGYVEQDGRFTGMERLHLLLLRLKLESGHWPFESLSSFVCHLERDELEADELADLLSVLANIIMKETKFNEERRLLLSELDLANQRTQQLSQSNQQLSQSNQQLQDELKDAADHQTLLTSELERSKQRNQRLRVELDGTKKTVARLRAKLVEQSQVKGSRFARLLAKFSKTQK